jgi:hypothetical protein
MLCARTHCPSPSKLIPARHRHDIDNRTWASLEPHLPRRKGAWGGIAHDNRTLYQRCALDIMHRRSLARLFALEALQGYSHVVFQEGSIILGGSADSLLGSLVEYLVTILYSNSWLLFAAALPNFLPTPT